MTMSGHAQVLSQLLPPVSYDPNAPYMAAEVGADGAVLDGVYAAAWRLARAADPAAVIELLDMWETELGLETVPGWGEVDRLARVLAKLLERGGLSRAYFISLAAALGVQIEIVEPAALYVDDMAAGDWLYDRESTYCWAWFVRGQTWHVEHVHWLPWAGELAAGERLYLCVEGWAGDIAPFQAGVTDAGMPVVGWGDARVDALFEQLKPAHTWQSPGVRGGSEPLRPRAETWATWFRADALEAGSPALSIWTEWRLPGAEQTLSGRTSPDPAPMYWDFELRAGDCCAGDPVWARYQSFDDPFRPFYVGLDAGWAGDPVSDDDFVVGLNAGWAGAAAPVLRDDDLIALFAQ